MKIVREEVTVVPDVDAREVLVLLGGYRISLSEEEGAAMAAALGAAVSALERHRAPVALTPASTVPRETAESEAALEGLVRVFESRAVAEPRRDGFRPL